MATIKQLIHAVNRLNIALDAAMDDVKHDPKNGQFTGGSGGGGGGASAAKPKGGKTATSAPKKKTVSIGGTEYTPSKLSNHYMGSLKEVAKKVGATPSNNKATMMENLKKAGVESIVASFAGGSWNYHPIDKDNNVVKK